MSAEVGYQLRSSWLNLSLSGYYSKITDGTEWQNFYYDDVNSFTYISFTDVEKEYYGVELGANVKINSAFSVKLLGQMSEAKYANNSNVRYMNSTSAKYTEEICYNKDMRENGTPLTALSLGLSYHSNGWYIDLNGNYYDRIYLSYSPSYRYESSLQTVMTQAWRYSTMKATSSREYLTRPRARADLCSTLPSAAAYTLKKALCLST